MNVIWFLIVFVGTAAMLFTDPDGAGFVIRNRVKGNIPEGRVLQAYVPDIYGKEDYAALCARIYAHAQSRGIAVECFQSNHEGAIIDAIQEADGMFDGIVINPGAYAHYSYAIRDAIKAITVPVVEVHISDIEKREEFRHLSVTAPVCIAQIRGHGFESYTMGIDLLAGAKQ